MADFLVAAVIGLTSIMFLVAWFAWNLKDGIHEAYAMFCLLMSSALSVGVAGFIRSSMDNSPGSYSEVLGVLDVFYYAVIVWFVVSLMYFILRVMVSPMIAASNKRRFKMS